jgi:hypothetical protein
MRTAIILPMLMLAACQVSKDGNNDSVTVAYNQDVAENAAADVGNTAQNIAADVSNDVARTADKIDNKVGDGADNNTASNTPANKQ